MTRGTRTLLILSLVSVVALPALANDVECGPPGLCGPGLGGTNFSLKVIPDNGSDKAYVQSTEPAGETSFNVDFRVDPQTVTLENNKLLRTHLAFGAQHHILVQLQWKSGPATYKMWMWAREDLAANAPSILSSARRASSPTPTIRCASSGSSPLVPATETAKRGC